MRQSSVQSRRSSARMAAVLLCLALAAPLFAAWPGPYLIALAQSALVVGACVLWVLNSDATFQDAAEQVVARKEQAPFRTTSYRARATALSLAPTGRPERSWGRPSRPSR